jgi:hypothetical protein
MAWECTDAAYCPTREVFADLEEFAAYVAAVFGERVELTTPDLGDTYVDARGAVVLRRVDA